MRKLILVIVAVLTPIGLWTAGCRQSRQSAFPTTPEMKSIARAPEDVHPTRPPVIAAAIDREVLDGPDQPTLARLNAVNDYSIQRAYRDPNPDIFILSDSGYDVYSLPAAQPVTASYVEATPTSQPVLATLPEPIAYQPPVPTPAPTQFWSRPARPLPERTSLGQPIPGDVYAMMPAGPVVEPLPEKEVTPAVFVPDNIPGVFMGSEDADLMGSEWIGHFSAPAFPVGPGPITSDAFASVPVEELNRRLVRESQPPAGAIRELDLVELLMPPMALPTSPTESEALAELFDANGILQALEPLPDLSELRLPVPISVEPEMVAVEVPGEVELASLDFMPPPPMAGGKDAASLNQRDLYRMDLPAARQVAMPEPLPAPDREATETVSVKKASSLGVVEPESSAVSVDDNPAAAEVMRRLQQSFADAQSKMKVFPDPIRPPSSRAAFGLDHIDSNIEVPPLRF